MATPTAEELKNLSPEDAANAAKFNTPLPPGDPASLGGARENPNYIGPTNFGNLQKQYTPYQIEQATIRDAQGNVFWNPDKNIADIPVAPPTPGMTPSVTPTPKAEDLSRFGEAPTMPSASNSTLEISKSISDAANKFLTTDIDRTLQDLLKQQTEAINAEKVAAQAKQDALTNRLDEISQKTAAQDALDAARKKFEVDANIQRYQMIQQNIIDAQSALDQGLVYEASRPVRMALMTGRSNELRQQGLAMIGTMQATASLVRGNIEMADAYANNTIDAINADNTRQEKALYTLLDLASKDVVRLDDAERETINNRLSMIADQSAQLAKNKTAVLDLMTSAPTAALKGKVLITDTQEQALQKMLPFLSEQEQAEIALKTAKARGTGSGSGSYANLEEWRSKLSVSEKTALADTVGSVLESESREEAIQFLRDNAATIVAKFGQEGLEYLAQQVDSKFGVPTEDELKAAETAGVGSGEERQPFEFTATNLGKTARDITKTIGGATAAAAATVRGLPGAASDWIQRNLLAMSGRAALGRSTDLDRETIEQGKNFMDAFLGQ